MKNDNQYLLEIKDLSIIYQPNSEQIKAVDKLSLQLDKEESLGIIGESGSGKSSLALAIMGLIKAAETTGEIIYNGHNLAALSDKELNKFRWQKIALVFQNSIEIFNPVLTIGEQIKEPLRTHYNFSPKELNKKVRKLLELVGLDPKWSQQYPHNLSGGMRQRALLAMALSCEPELLIIDEPITALDPVSKEEILELLNKLQDEFGFAMIIISHDLITIREFSSRVMTMYAGQVVELGLTDKVFKEPCHPYTRGLLNSSPSLFKYKDLWGIEGEISQGQKKGCLFSLRCPQSEQSCTDSQPTLEYVGLERMVACHKRGIEKFLEAKEIKKSYRLKGERIEAVKGVSLEIKSGEVVALVGESGSGKSTLAHTLAGIIKPDNGEIYYKDREVKSNWATKEVGGMQIIFQDATSATSSRMSVLDVVKEPLDIINWADAEQREKKAIKCLKKVQLPSKDSFLTRYCHSLSGGQRQRLSIARSLVTDPELLIADEITSMLDPSTQANLLRKLKGLQNRFGFAMLYITHDLHLARKIADKVYVMHQGEIVEAGAAFEILENPSSAYTKKLLASAFKGLI